jgi:threonine dehydratase
MTGSFKERGALNRLLALSDAERAVGIVASSAGNHAQAVAYIARRLDIRATIIMPEAYDVACSIQQERGLVFIHPYDGDLVIAGQGTIGLELLEQEPALEVIVVPVGGGGLVAGIGIAVKDLSPRVEIIGVEAASYPTAQRSLA